MCCVSGMPGSDRLVVGGAVALRVRRSFRLVTMMGHETECDLKLS